MKGYKKLSKINLNRTEDQESNEIQFNQQTFRKKHLNHPVFTGMIFSESNSESFKYLKLFTTLIAIQTAVLHQLILFTTSIIIIIRTVFSRSGHFKVHLVKLL